ncbi:uncharacterized protein N7515_000799 [Penicillium bovifimosum]|uniref:Knr4/Smi1-like domain-containing protein n=1 Tax=Penicillium bovifimosum TaxID=126998 RepID=A0A9W9HI39_9EURO|nr:uncharacterized protein N7515_000799 [Penicillium bovifimosum]KAJ5146235.1 hypothetical protein N7515_000799 [Penicillium bovifimosum]
MSIRWVNPGNNEPNTLPWLIKSYIDREDPSPAMNEMIHLAELLILSNHLTEAHLIVSAVCKLAENFETNAKGEPLAYEIGIPYALQTFWHIHKDTFPLPKRLPPGSSTAFSEKELAEIQWNKFRECTRTGWMLDRLGVVEPSNPSSIWRDTDSPEMLAMCARLLAKTTTPGTYPPDNVAREAVEVAQKLYAMPQTPLEECGWDAGKPHRHWYLLYRRLVVELAIRVGELQTAADVLGQGLREDGFTTGDNLSDLLLIPGIYDVLPLLTAGGKVSNPFFISKEEAVVMVREIVAALELRAEHGRQWELHPSKVGWRELLDRLAEGTWKAHNKECREMGLGCAQDVLFEPATEEEIAAAEKKFGELPADFKEMVRISNGQVLQTPFLAKDARTMEDKLTNPILRFKGGWHFFGGGLAGIRSMSMDESGCADVGYMHYEDELEDFGLSEMIELRPGTESDSFSHYIVSPKCWKEAMEKAGKEVKDGDYQYWYWAYWWGSGIRHFDSVRDFVAHCVEEVEEMIEKGGEEYDG